MAKKIFTAYDIAFLRQNPYTASVNEHNLSFTVAFKIEFIRLYEQNIPPREILPQLGYPLEIIGKARLNGISQKIRNESVSEQGFKENRDKRNLEDLPASEVSTLTERQIINRLQCEVAYLRQEMEFLKKISETGNNGKQRRS